MRSADAIAELSLPVLLNMQWIPDFLHEDVEVVYRQFSPHVAGFLMTGNPERPLDGLQLTYLTDLARKFPLWIGSNMLQNPVRTMIQSVRPAGLVLEGGEEIKPGLRDFTEMEAVFEQLEDE
jgi:phosphoribosylanthranilate isomerase